jgi:hypothetical protein
MTEPDYMKLMVDLWLKRGDALSSGQQAMFKSLAERMTQGVWPGILPWPGAVPEAVEFNQAGEAFQKLMQAWGQLPATVMQGTTGIGDRVSAALLQKIFDPREWLSATGLMDESVRHLVEGPRLADWGQIEGKFLALMKAWSEFRAESLNHSTHYLEAWTKAAQEFSAKLNEAAEKGTPLGSRAELVAAWVDTANQHLLQMQHSAPYLETQRKLLRASTELRLVQQEIGDFYSEILGVPTRAEIDDLSRTVAELRRAFRADQRQRNCKPRKRNPRAEKVKD